MITPFFKNVITVSWAINNHADWNLFSQKLDYATKSCDDGMSWHVQTFAGLVLHGIFFGVILVKFSHWHRNLQKREEESRLQQMTKKREDKDEWHRKMWIIEACPEGFVTDRKRRLMGMRPKWWFNLFVKKYNLDQFFLNGNARLCNSSATKQTWCNCCATSFKNKLF